MRKSKSMRVYTFAFALMLTLLLSSMIGTTAGKKPDNPGPKPPPPPETFLFDIFIEGQVDLFEPEYLVVNSSVCSGGWYDDPAKKTKADGWGADLNEFWPRSEEGEECGKYTTSDLGEVPVDIDAQSFQINYLWISKQTREFNGQPVNFWEFYITWGWHEDDWDPSDVHSLRVWTDWNAEPEGTYDLEEDTWIVDFNGASWELWASDADGYGHLKDYGTISNDLTVTIIKTT